MVKKLLRPNRRVDSGVPHVLPEFLERLARATRWDGEICSFVDDGEVKPGSAKSGWHVTDPSRFGVDYLWQEILSKYDDGESSLAKETLASERFTQAEVQCAVTNSRLSFDHSQFHHREATELHALIDSARRKIGRLLGRLDLNRVADGFSFTSGASTRIPSRTGDAAYKYSGVPETTYGNLDLATAAIRTVPLWEKRLRLQGDAGLCNISPGNKIVTVPKNYKTHRTIAIEPCMNMYIQKGFAAVLRRCLRKVGIDIRSQSLNQDLALYASKTDSMATIDMSMASDTVSYELVRLLLPPDWFAAMEQSRSPCGVLPSGEKIVYRKFSSMGNGYTFELETLIFWALSSAVCTAYGASERLIAVYGDDVIVPSSVASQVIELLEFCGFTTNESKTFVSGPFRESCGKHYISGLDVTPFYVKRKVSLLTDLFLLHNQVYRWCMRNQWNTQWDRVEMRSLLCWLRSQAPSAWRRPRLPDGRGDGAFIGTFDEARPRLASSNKKMSGWEGFLVEVLVDVTPLGDFYDEGFGVKTKAGFSERSGPDILGRLLKSIRPIPPDPLIHLGGSLVGAIPLGPRKRVLTTLVPQFATLDPCVAIPAAHEGVCSG